MKAGLTSREEVRMCRKKVTLENKYGSNTRIAGILAQKSRAYQSDIIMEYEGNRVYTWVC